ncbi:MAG TPA: hypothetical protein VFR10_06150 [bacterium]|nr:hypothetical protein [bacterium]
MAGERMAARMSLGAADRSAVPDQQQIIRLVDAYRRTLSRYRRIQSLSAHAVEKLKSGCEVREVNATLVQKKALMQEIREEEERVSGAREWWKRTRQTLPAEDCRELLSLLDAIGKTLEDTMEHEEECRVLLRERSVWRPRRAGVAGGGTPAVAALPSAHAAYRAQAAAQGESR